MSHAREVEVGIPTGAPGEARLSLSPGAAGLRDDLRFGSSERAEVSGLGLRGESIPALGSLVAPRSYPVDHVGGRDRLRLRVDPYPPVVRHLVEDRDATGGGARFEGANTPFGRGGGKGRGMKGSQAAKGVLAASVARPRKRKRRKFRFRRG